jgi:RNA recognition motif-containing protein
MSSRIYVGNLSFHSTTEAVREAFAQHGSVTDVHVVLDRQTGQSRGFAFVTMGTDAEASKAIQAMNGASLDGRALRVNEAEERPQRSGGFGGGGGGGDRARGGERGDRRGGSRW